MRVDLITGFLGAGKTTFIKKYVSYLKEKGERFRIIENEFCAWGVDTKLLKDTHDDIRDLSGYCMCCTGKDKFISMLAEAGQEGYDRVLVEPSGIYDVDEFFSVMNAPVVASCCEIGSVITILDVCPPEENSRESSYLMLTQLLAAGCILISKTLLYDERTKEDTLAFVSRRLSPYLTDGHVPMVISKDWNELTEEDYLAIQSSGFYKVSHAHLAMDHGSVYDTWMSMAGCTDEEDLTEKIRRMFHDPACGQVLRVKGYAKDREGIWYAVNCTGDVLDVQRSDIKRGLLIVIGQDLNEDALKEIV
ncbi:MAG: GTP-binding protein [Lachnospiraceae bacterium]|nr:GTP-binding protein [Lachnospiraceae bacterium]